MMYMLNAHRNSLINVCFLLSMKEMPALERDREVNQLLLQNCRDTIRIPAGPPWSFHGKLAEISLAVFRKVGQNQGFLK